MRLDELEKFIVNNQVDKSTVVQLTIIEAGQPKELKIALSFYFNGGLAIQDEGITGSSVIDVGSKMHRGQPIEGRISISTIQSIKVLGSLE